MVKLQLESEDDQVDQANTLNVLEEEEEFEKATSCLDRETTLLSLETKTESNPHEEVLDIAFNVHAANSLDPISQLRYLLANPHQDSFVESIRPLVLFSSTFTEQLRVVPLAPELHHRVERDLLGLEDH